MIRVLISLVFLVTCLGASPVAQAYPATSVSVGSNPVRSAAGLIDFASGTTASNVIEAPADQDLILTDIVLGCAVETNGYISAHVRLIGSDGVVYGAYALQSGQSTSVPNASANFAGTTGVRIPAGVSISVLWTIVYQSHLEYAYTGAYTLAGYLATR